MRRKSKAAWVMFSIGLAVGIIISFFTEFGSMSETICAYTLTTLVFWLSTRDKIASLRNEVHKIQRFAEFGKLSSGIFHDIMNPLLTISLAVEKLKERPNGTDLNTTEHIETAIRASKRIESSVHTARKQLYSKNNKSIFSLGREIEEAIKMNIYQARLEHIEIKTDFTTDHVLYGDSTQFFRIINNLIANALDSYKDVNSHDPRERIITIDVIQKAEKIEMCVKDTGCGIPFFLQSKIFEPFFTTKSERNGTGLGLSVIKESIEKDFGGKIRVKSRPHKGTSFILVVPSAGIEPTSAR